MDAPNQQHIRARYAELCRLQGRGERSIEGPPRFELYDIAADPGETKDLAAATPGVVEAMKRQYDGWFTDVAARWADRKERPGRLRRKDCYFGVHFDFHAEPSDRNIGQNTTREMVHALIDLIQPDFIQVDSKGHPGLSSYPTRVGNHGGSFVGDPLRVWRDVTAERGVALFAHHSGLCDGRAMKDHPAWACVDAQGRTNDAYVALSGPYVDKLLIPQLIELAVDYELDGAWIDAECMGAKIDYSDASRNAFTQQTGIAAIPLKPGDPGWHAWTQFHRETFRKYLRHYTSEVRKKAPGFQLCSNYSFLIPMPEPVSAGVAFLSADVMDLDHMRLYSRFMASQGIPGDLMSWSFTTWGLGTLDPPESRKPAVQLMREAACGIAQGIGYQAVFSQAGAGRPPLRDGSVDLEKLKPMGEVAKFCRERQEVCFKAKPVPQIAVLISAGAQYRKMSRTSDRLFAYEGAHAGIALGLLDNQYAVDVVHGARLVERLQEYPMVVLCEEDYLEPDLRERIGRHVRQGGRLLLVGDGMARLFNSEIGGSARQGALQGPAAAAIACYNVGKGILGVLPGPSVAEYARNADPAVRDMIGAAARALFPEPIAVIAGCRGLDVSVMRTRAGGLAVHLVNTTGPHGQSALLPAIAPVGPVSVTIHCESKPVRVVLEPGGRAIGHTYENGLVRLTLDEVKLHEIIVVD